ncbi:MAG: right-handed parallel beta-helix repeat-containing protein [Candidatus Aenigmarchaeota archaeon]|nr:right-handed parallel beta-helix repeat-containing protein [Candidatus Aenigmarchaeota archaeon]
MENRIVKTGFNAEKTRKVFSFSSDASGHLKNLLFGLVAVICIMIFSSGISFGMSNPSAVYCTEMGYNYEVKTNGDGEQEGVCIVSNNAKFNAWDFFNGKTGQEFSYCAKQGYDIKTVKTGNSYSLEHAVCVPKNKEFTTTTSNFVDEYNIISMTEMMSLDEKISRPNFKPDLTKAKEIKDNSLSVSSLKIGTNDDDYYDWRTHNNEDWMSPVKDQASCGSCWAFSANGAVEAKYNINQDNSLLNPDLAEQYLVSSCCNYCGDCGGGNEILALDYIKEDGISDESCFPYTASNSNCNGRCSDWNTRLWNLSGGNYGVYWYGFPNDELKNWTRDYGPLPIAMDFGDGDGFDGDNIYRCNEDGDLNHAVVLTGYNDTGNDTTSYWIIKNSWGSTWNGDGYFKVGFNECNVTDYVNYVDTVNPPNLKPSIVLNSPSNNHTENSNKTTFNFTVYNQISENSTCNLIIDGTVESSTNAVNATPTTMTHNLPDGTYSWNIECWENGLGIANSSETRILNVNILTYYISDCSVLNKAGATYHLTGNILNSNTDRCIEITANNVNLYCQNHIIDGTDTTTTTHGIYSNNNDTLVHNCTIRDWTHGIKYYNANSGHILNNKIYSNTGKGIFLGKSSHNKIAYNEIYDNEYGLRLEASSNNNNINDNTITLNDNGLSITPSCDNPNLIYNNYFSGNTINAEDGGDTFWNTGTIQPGPNIVGGQNISGNYFSDYNGTDNNGDGFGDTPYNITGTGNNQDNYPLMVIPEVPTIFLSIGLMFLSMLRIKNKFGE